MKQIPDQSFWKLWNISFGFFGVQIAYALQSANISRIFSTLGADPHNLNYFWILPPLMGIIVQPIIGALSVNDTSSAAVTEKMARSAKIKVSTFFSNDIAIN